MKISRDANGNKIVQIEAKDFNNGRGFSIQTAGNLPFIHGEYEDGTKICMTKVNPVGVLMAQNEIRDYVNKYGTDLQKKKVAVKSPWK